MSDEDDLSVTEFAKRFQIEAAAALVAILRDSDSTPSARVASAERILNFAVGRPGQAKQITVADLAGMSDDERWQLLKALILHYTPNGFTQLITEAVDAALAIQKAEWEAKLPRTTNFVRRAPIVAPPVVPQAREPDPPPVPVQEVIPPLPANVTRLPVYGTYETLQETLRHTAVNSGTIHPDVVAKSRRPAGIAQDYAIRDYRPWYC